MTAWLSGTAAVVLIGTLAFAGQGLIRDRRITLSEAEHLAQVASEHSTFPIVVNEAVVDELNRFVGTPGGRAYFKDSLARMEGYRPMLEQELEHYSMPEELLAVPVIESGYRNQIWKSQQGAGLWGFISSTARHFNLRVDNQVDDRLNPRLETGAAFRYLEANHLRFQDWLLALFAYNAGEGSVQQAIDATGSRDVWKLIHAGYENDDGYVAKVMAAILVLKNPTILD